MRTDPDHFSRRKQNLRVLYNIVGLHQRSDHIRDLLHKAVRRIFPLLDTKKLLLPVCRHGGRLDLFRHHRYQRRSFCCRAKMPGFPVSPTLDKAFLYQLLNRGSSCGRRTDTLSLRFLRHLIGARRFHCLQQSILRKIARCGTLAFLYPDIQDGQCFPFRKCRELSLFLSIFLFGLSRAKSCLNLLPTGIQDAFSLHGKLLTGAEKNDYCLCIAAGFADCSKQPSGDQSQHLLFTRWQAGYVCSGHGSCRDNGVVIRNPAAVNHLICNHRKRELCTICFCYAFHQPRDHILHIVRQIPAVCSGISDEFLFIQTLGIIQGLLGGEAQDTVGISLQACQIVKSRSILRFLLPLCTHDRCPALRFTPALQLLCLFFILEFPAGSCNAIHPELYRIKRLRLKGSDGGIPHHHHGQSRCHHPADCQCLPVQA